MDKDDARFILVFAENNMNKSLTAQILRKSPMAVHRKIEKITKRTGLNPNFFWDLVKLCEKAKEKY